MNDRNFGFIGAGFMAEAVLRGILKGQVFPTQTIVAADVAETRRRAFAALGVETTADALEIVRTCRVVLVAVKPQDLAGLLDRIGPKLTAEHFLLTVCAGCPTGQFEDSTPADVRVVRVMPNLPLSVGIGATALCTGKHATPSDLDLAKRIFGAAGAVVVVDESAMDAVTAVSGSGPAYVYLLAEAMIEAGLSEGLSADTARTLAVQTIRGAAQVMAVDEASPAELRKRVTSKGGTTEAAFRVLAEGNAHETLVRAIRAAAARSRELGNAR